MKVEMEMPTTLLAGGWLFHGEEWQTKKNNVMVVLLILIISVVTSRQTSRSVYSYPGTKVRRLTMNIYGKFFRPVKIDLGMLGSAQGKLYMKGELSVSFRPRKVFP